MIAMQYAIDLPAEYDMEILHKRVRDNGSKTDGFRDLEMKAYLIAEKGKYGNARNQYAPFYLWRDTGGMNEFILHGPFNNILGSFGWPQIRTWFSIQETVRPPSACRLACIDTRPIPPYSDFPGIVRSEKETAASLRESVSLVSAYNPCDWEVCRLWMADSQDELPRETSGKLIYDIHHVSSGNM